MDQLGQRRRGPGGRNTRHDRTESSRGDEAQRMECELLEVSNVDDPSALRVQPGLLRAIETALDDRMRDVQLARELAVGPLAAVGE